MKILFSLTFIFYSIVGASQNDTIIYFSKLNREVKSSTDAQYYNEIKVDKRGNISQKLFQLKDKKWISVYESRIHKENDTSFSYYSILNKKEKNIRSFCKTDSGYYLRDYQNSRLVDEGFSKTIFPEIKGGPWKTYNPSDGRLISEGIFIDNQLITNRNWLPDGSCIKDVFTYVDKQFEYEGGEEMLLKYIAVNTNYPEAARDNNITGRVIVRFILMSDGSIKGIEFIQRANYLLEVEALRVINSIPKSNWKPAEINGQKVNTPILIPVSFNITESFVQH